MNYKANQIIQLVLKFGLPLLSVLFIWYKINTSAAGFDQVFLTLNKYDVRLVFCFVIINLILSSFNWLLDSLKWKLVLKPKINISFKIALFQNLKSHSLAIFTPNRLGDYIAKALFYDSFQRQYVAISNGVSQFSQLLSTIVFGGFGLVYFINFTFKEFQNFQFLVIGLVVILVVFAFIQYHPKLRKKLILIKPYLSKFPKQIGLSLLKHLVFSHQLVLILWAFGIKLSYLDTLMAVNVMYILSSVIPSFFVVDVAIKSSLGLLIFGYLNQTPSLILTGFSLMWLFNFALPAMIGSLLQGLYRTKLKANVIT